MKSTTIVPNSETLDNAGTGYLEFKGVVFNTIYLTTRKGGEEA